MTKTIPKVSLKDIPRAILYDFYIDWHEKMCFAHSTSYKYSNLFPRLSVEERKKYFDGKVKPSLEYLREYVTSCEDFKDYYRDNYEGVLK